MARLIGGLGTSHVPSIAAALDKGLRDSDEWKPFFDGYVHRRTGSPSGSPTSRW